MIKFEINNKDQKPNILDLLFKKPGDILGGLRYLIKWNILNFTLIQEYLLKIMKI
ncbi:MAG: hypothetical protein ACTSQP_14275 [Promethearchaeota archaeon]